MGTEVRSFYSLGDILGRIDEEISNHKILSDEYSQRLGSFLRNMEPVHKDEEWFKQISILEKSGKKESSKESKKGNPKKSASVSEWISYKDIVLSGNEQAEAEILFDAIEEINRKVDRLVRVKSILEDLEKSGLGKDIVYVTFIHDGVPEKIALHQRKEKELGQKFQFIADFSNSKEPIAE